MSELAARRSQGYWLLSRLFLQVPDREHLLTLQQEMTTTDAGSALAELRHAVDRALSAPDEAAVEFTRRLVVIGRDSGEPLPYESFFREGTVPGTATEEVMNCMLDAGFADVAPEATAPDHIGTELKFMALLCYEESQAWARERSEALRLLERQRDFLNTHLAAWAPGYCAELAARCADGYMKTVAQLAHGGVRDDLELVEGLCVELS